MHFDRQVVRVFLPPSVLATTRDTATPLVQLGAMYGVTQQPREPTMSRRMVDGFFVDMPQILRLLFTTLIPLYLSQQGNLDGVIQDSLEEAKAQREEEQILAFQQVGDVLDLTFDKYQSC